MDYTLTNFITPKLARNATAGCHAILATVLAGGCLIADEKTFDGAYKILKLFSTGYFMYDIHYIFSFSIASPVCQRSRPNMQNCIK